MPYALGPVKDHVRAAAESIGTQFGIDNVLGVGLRANDSDHPKGLALDFMTGDKAKGDSLAQHVVSNASAYGVTYVIWYQRIWSVERAAEGWRSMKDRGSDTANHKDHVHVSFSSTPGTGVPVSSGESTGGTGLGCAILLIAAAGMNGGIWYVIHRLIGA